jgi:hypothetical protein
MCSVNDRDEGVKAADEPNEVGQVVAELDEVLDAGLEDSCDLILGIRLS